jgi:hypothetical protein
MVELTMKPCNLTREEWDFLYMVFEDYIENLDSSEDTEEMLKEIHQKIFFMDHLIQQEESE